MKRSTAIWILVLLTAINFFNYIDRFVIAGMFDSLHEDFGITETSFGLLTTITFGIHAATTIPFGWLADRYDRRKLITFAVVAWSLATMACAVATHFWVLASLRGFVGLAEAAYGPASIAILCEIFPEDKKAQTVGIYNVGMFLGTTVGLVVGGNLTRYWAFMVVGVPGILLGFAALVMPIAKTRVDRHVSASPTGGVSLAGAFRQILKELVALMSSKTLRWLLIGGVFVSFSAGGYITFVQTFVTKYKHFADERQASLWLGMVVLTAGPLGILVGGYLADKLQLKHAWGRVMTVALGFALCTPFGLLIVYVDATTPFLASAWGVIFFMVWYNGPISAVIDDCVDPKDAASAQATFNFVIHLLGTAPAGVAIGYAAERTQSRHAFVLPAIAAMLGVTFFLMAARHVRSDMAARAARMAAYPVARAAQGHEGSVALLRDP